MLQTAVLIESKRTGGLPNLDEIAVRVADVASESQDHGPSGR